MRSDEVQAHINKPEKLAFGGLPLNCDHEITFKTHY